MGQQEHVSYVRMLPADLVPLVEAYHQACVDDINWLDWNTDYSAGWWKSSVKAKGGAQASVDLLRRGRGKPQSGYFRLLEMQMVERSVEYAVLRPEWRPVFSYFPDVMDYARQILRVSGVTPPDEVASS